VYYLVQEVKREEVGWGDGWAVGGFMRVWSKEVAE
jgi:hypothetical protein